MIVYDKLWELLKRQEISKYHFRIYTGIGGNTYDRLRKNLSVSVSTLNTICGVLRCNINDIMEFIYDDEEFKDILPIEDIKHLIKRNRTTTKED
jgi:Predicted transcriptional regulator